MVYGYARVSTRSQISNNSTQAQADRIRQIYPGAKIATEQVSGVSKVRPVLASVLKLLKEGDTLAVSSLDRLARSTLEGVQLVEELQGRGVAVHVCAMGLLDSSPAGKMLTTMLLAFADFERATTMERVRAGKEIAKTRDGFRDGRPKKFSSKQLAFALELSETKTLSEVQKLTGVSPSTLKRYKVQKRLAGL